MDQFFFCLKQLVINKGNKIYVARMLFSGHKAAINPLSKLLGDLLREVTQKIQIAVKNVFSPAVIKKSIYEEIFKFC